MKTVFGLVIAALLLTACAAPRERAGNSGDGSNKMKISPCVGGDGSPCAPVDFNSRGFTWVG